MSENYTLVYPVKAATRTIETVKMRRPTVNDLEVIDDEKSNLKKSILLVQRCGQLAPEEVRALDAEDFDKMSKLVEAFLS